MLFHRARGVWVWLHLVCATEYFSFIRHVRPKAQDIHGHLSLMDCAVFFVCVALVYDFICIFLRSVTWDIFIIINWALDNLCIYKTFLGTHLSVAYCVRVLCFESLNKNRGYHFHLCASFVCRWRMRDGFQANLALSVINLSLGCSVSVENVTFSMFRE